MLENLINIMFGNLYSKSLYSFIEFINLNLLIVILIKEQEGLSKTLELLLNFNGDESHDLTKMLLVILHFQLH